MRKWTFILGLVVLLPLFTLTLLGSRIRAMVRERSQNILQTHFASNVEFSNFEVSLYPRVRVTIRQLVLRHHGRTDVPPLIQVRAVTMTSNLISLLGAKPRIKSVDLEGLQIHIPPRQTGDPSLIQRTDQDLAKKYPALIEEMRADDAIIVILRAQPEKPPRDFPIHHLELHNVSFDRPAAFHATLTNSLPAGEIETTGEFGPWQADAPSKNFTVGKYKFRNADLGTLKGLRGILSSEGSFSGPLDYLKVEGTTDTPDFCLRTADHPMSLHTEFSAVVDGTNGDTYLDNVTARFQHTTIIASGKIEDADPEVKGKTILLEASSQDARVEDLIRLAVKTDQPLMTGIARLKAKIAIPEGESDLIERLRIQGEFLIAGGQFTTGEIQDKVDTLSRKGQGQPKAMEINSVASDMAGKFQVRKGTVNFSNLKFGVAGASINLRGTYNLDGGGLDFHGNVALQAKLSQTTTGAKSFFLKALDPFFKGQNAGTVLPIKITGTKDNPTFAHDRGGDAHKLESSVPKAGK
ncbi:MAG TPA: AsmA-like C-terminal region-containing protein [Candidatus Acidoferrum sp.]|nr:AsmA-like C-terminal region-containing protein [Candidatus Acidoferrum sp.]